MLFRSIAHCHSDTSRQDAISGILRRAYLRTAKQWIQSHATHLVGASMVAGRALFGGKWDADARKRLLARKQDLLIDAVSALAAAADPESHAKYDYQRVVTLIHRVQLVLDPRVHADASLNQATTDLGLAIRAAAAGDGDDRTILAAQSQLIEAARQVLRPVDLLP